MEELQVQRYFDSINKKCPCNPGYYDNGDLFCQKCHNSCLTCDGLGDSSCLTCPQNSNRKDNSNPL
jgi:proprotein convertase subtilisin/kexin type 5